MPTHIRSPVFPTALANQSCTRIPNRQLTSHSSRPGLAVCLPQFTTLLSMITPNARNPDACNPCPNLTHMFSSLPSSILKNAPKTTSHTAPLKSLCTNERTQTLKSLSPPLMCTGSESLRRRSVVTMVVRWATLAAPIPLSVMLSSSI